MGTPAASTDTGDAQRPAFRVRALDCRDVDATTAAAWARLEGRALEANAYLSPHFVLPAVRHLESSPRPIALLVERDAGDLAAVGVFMPRRAAKDFPLPHLTAYRSRHTYLTGLLVDRADGSAAIGALLDFVRRRRWHAIEFTWRSAQGPLADLLDAECGRRGSVWHERARSQRSTLDPARAGEEYLRERLSRSRLKDLRRLSRQLGELGQMDWRLREAKEDVDGCVERFLALEHLGWKGTEGTSLRSHPEDETFFREAATGFAHDGRAWFTELDLDGQAIASTCNFTSGDAGFAFKVGWDPAYAKYSPGLLNEVELIRHAAEHFANLRYLDSGATEGSYIDEYWDGRRALTSGIYTTSSLGRHALALVEAARRVKGRLLRAG